MSVSPVARKLNASLPELKFQVSVLVVCVPLSIAVGETDKKLRNVAFVNPDGTLVAPVPVTTTESTAAVTLSVKSRSVTVKLPESLSPAFVSVNEEVSGPPVITGASAVPVMVTVTVSVSLRGEPSSSVALTV